MHLIYLAHVILVILLNCIEDVEAGGKVGNVFSFKKGITIIRNLIGSDQDKKKLFDEGTEPDDDSMYSDDWTITSTDGDLSPSTQLEQIQSWESSSHPQHVRPSVTDWKRTVETNPWDAKTSLDLKFQEVDRDNHTTLYNVKNKRDMMVKYHVHCFTKSDPVDSNLVDYWFIQQLKESGIVVYPIYLSAPINPFVEHVESGGKIQEPLKFCKTGKASVRFMIIGGIDESLYNSVKNNPLLISDALSFGYEIIDSLKYIHGRNIIHGGIDLHSIVISDPNFSTRQVLLMNFGRGRIIEKNKIIEAGQACTANVQKIDPKLSWWETRGCPSSFRDDVYRGLIVMISLMFEAKDFVQHENRWIKETREYEEGATRKPDLINDKDFLTFLHKHIPDNLQTTMQNIFWKVFEPKIDGKPDYEGIKQQLKYLLIKYKH